MKITKKNRKFKVGKKNGISLTHVATITLKKDEIITFKEEKKEYDLGKKDWGYYGTPTLNEALAVSGGTKTLKGKVTFIRFDKSL